MYLYMQIQFCDHFTVSTVIRRSLNDPCCVKRRTHLQRGALQFCVPLSFFTHPTVGPQTIAGLGINQPFASEHEANSDVCSVKSVFNPHVSIKTIPKAQR